MKIVQINAVFGISSTGATTKEMHDYLIRCGHESFVFCSNTSQPDKHIYCMGNEVSRKLHGLLSRITGLQGYFSIYATLLLMKQLKQIAPDVVVLRNLHANYINVNLLLDFLAKHRIPTVVVLHDCWLYTGHCCHYIEEGCCRWMEKCGHCPAKRKWNKSFFFDQSAKVLRDRKKRFSKLESLTVVGVSDWVTNECRKSFMKQNARFLRIYNWIDLDTFIPSKEPVAKERPIILSVAHGWSNEKGLKDVLDVAAQYPAYDFVLIGQVPPELKSHDNIIFVGPTNDRKELVSWYQRADVMLHLSYQETFGKVVIEAMACGKPAIVYDTTALPELIRPSCGSVVKKGDWEAAGRAVDAVIKTDGNDSLLIRKSVEDRFSMETQLQKWMQLFETIRDSYADHSAVY